MQDIFEYPTLISTEPEEQIKELVHYLLQFKETLEFTLANITTDNLSTDLVAKLNALGADIQSNREEREDQIQQVVNNSITVYDVIESDAYKASLGAVEDKIPAEYIRAIEQRQASAEPGGVNVYAITDASGDQTEVSILNGRTPNVTLTVNLATGNLEYTVT